MLTFLITALKIIFLLGFLILIHEGGHFLIAKLCKVKVNEFAIGFGPTIFKKQGKETKYALRLIPLGGFVNMEGEEERSEKEGSFSKASIPKRIAIVAAGGAVNILFGILIYFIIIASSGNFISTRIDGFVDENTISSLQQGDEIIKINNKKVYLPSDVTEQLDKLTQREEVTVTVKRNGEEIDVTVLPQEQTTKSLGIYFNAQTDSLSSEIMGVDSGSPAEKAGLQTNDIILTIEGQSVENNPYTVTNLINQSEKEEMEITVQRKEEQITLKVTPNIITMYRLGIIFAQAENNLGNSLYYGFLETKDFAFSIIDNLKQLFTGQVSTDQLMGPVGISGIVSDTEGFTDFIYILALVSLSLGVTNLLPFPPLDGGKIVILLIEGIRRKPLKENIEIGIQMAGFALLILLSIYVTYNDILRLW